MFIFNKCMHSIYFNNKFKWDLSENSIIKNKKTIHKFKRFQRFNSKE